MGITVDFCSPDEEEKFNIKHVIWGGLVLNIATVHFQGKEPVQTYHEYIFYLNLCDADLFIFILESTWHARVKTSTPHTIWYWQKNTYSDFLC